MRTLLTGALAVAALVLTGLATVTPAVPSFAAAGLTAYGPDVTILGDAAFPAGGAPGASLRTARNEFESFQVAIEAGTAIEDLRVDLAAPLTSDTGATLPSDHVTFYRESYFTVAADHRSDGESSVGQWPDALVPETDYVYGEYRPRFSTRVPAGGHAVVWVDVLAPAGQAPGTYRATLRVRDGAGAGATEVGTLPVSVEVRNFGLPSTSTLDNLFPMYEGDACLAHTGSTSCHGDIAQANRLAALYERVALENRLTISTPWAVDKGAALGSHAADWRRLVLPIVNGTAADASLGSPIRLAGARATDLSLWYWCGTACVNAWVDEAQQDGFKDRLLYYTCDEPGTSSAAWTACNDNHATVAGARGSLRELATAPISMAKTNGSGADAWIDDLVVLTRFMAGKDAAWAGNHRAAYDAWLAQAGDGQANRLWLYNSCEAAGCDGPDNSATWSSPTYDGWAGFGIDQPASQARAMPWLAYLYDATGELYWETGWRLNQAWNTCANVAGAEAANCQYYSGMNGDGTLFYPGRACPVGTAAGCLGGTHDIPVESIRLKRLRDGREDYEYLHQLEAGPDPDDRQLARTTALGLLGGSLDAATYSTTFGQASLDAARDALGDALDAPVTPAPPTVEIGDATVTEGTGADTTMHFTVTTHGDGGEGYVDVTGVPGTAGADDFSVGLASLDLAPDSTYDVPVTVAGDASVEATERFTVELSFNQGYELSDGSGLGTILDDDGPATSFRPDAELKRSGGRYVGGRVYDNDPRTVGADQSVTVDARRGATRTFYLRITNRGDAADDWALAESPAPAPAGFTRRYFLGSRNVTRDVVTGNLSLTDVAPGASRTLRVTIAPNRTTRIGRVGTWYLHAVHSPTSDHVRDVVRMRVRVARR